MGRPTTPDESIDILIVEDDPIVRLAERQLLEGAGYTCAEAEDGREAVEFARLRPPRLVLLDLMMPEMDGFSVAEQLRADPQTRDVPIHCLSGLDFPAARRAAKRSGCEVFIAKPFDLDALLDIVTTALTNKEKDAPPVDWMSARLAAADAAAPRNPMRRRF